MFIVHRFSKQLGKGFLLLVLLSFVGYAQDGKTLFQNNCASCHAVNKDLTGPALQGVRERVSDQQLLHNWIRNNKKVLAEGQPYFTELYNKWNKVAMNSFPSLTDEEITAILDYVDARAKELAATATAAGGAATNAGASAEDESRDVWLYGIISVALLLLVYLFGKVNRHLAEVVAAKKGETLLHAVPVYRDKRYWVIAGILIAIVVGVFLANEGMNVSLQQNYQPKQPIFFSHRVHAGINKINCEYCHSTVADSRHAMIPPVGVCMNCHKAINSYEGGEELRTEEGEIVDGSAEIQKLYEYANFKPGDAWTPAQGKKAIEWVRVHNLPDHVKFSHAQHVNAGQQKCATCHGQIEAMDEVYQYNTLAMGWCINCHRQTEVQFTNNRFYDMYKDLHQQLREGKIDKVTVEKIGGLECQKCHY